MTAAVPSCPNALKSRYVAHYVTRPHGTIHRTSPRRHPAPERGRVAARAAAMEAELMRPLEQWVRRDAQTIALFFHVEYMLACLAHVYSGFVAHCRPVRSLTASTLSKCT